MARDFDEGRDTHRRLGHQAFVRDAQKNNKNEIFIRNVCTDVRCDEK